MPMRQRRVDRAILSESSSDPIDSEDQKLIISQFRSDNDRRFQYSLRLLLVWIIAQTPLITMVAKPRLRANSIALLVVSNILVLINGVFEFPEWERRAVKEGKVSGSTERQSPLPYDPKDSRDRDSRDRDSRDREYRDPKDPKDSRGSGAIGESPYDLRGFKDIGAIGDSTNFGGNSDNFGDNFGGNFEKPKTTTSWLLLQVVSFRGVSVLTGVVLLQLLFSLRKSPRAHLLFIIVPLANLLLMVYVRKSHDDVHQEIAHLDSLRYKFKSA